MMTITLVNHACVKIGLDGYSILCDPWLEGAVFNDGWDLLIPTPQDLSTIMKDVRYIWMSHEHPDHFSPKFFARIKADYAGHVDVLFHETRDKRVKAFCESRGFKVIELADRRPTRLDGEVTVNCGRHDFYDSWLYLRQGHESLLNANDCQLSAADLRELQNIAPAPDVLLTQFSYAAWKGGASNTAYRAGEARHKLEMVAAQIRALKPKCTIPFASLIYFSNRENTYLNDHVNTPQKACDAIAAAGSSPAVLFPGDHWQLGSVHDNASALDRYTKVYSSLAVLPLRPAGDSVPIAELKSLFGAFQKRIFAKNSRLLVSALSRLPFVQVFRPVKVRLTDHEVVFRVSLVDGLEVSDNTEIDVAMHSTSLAYVFKYEFGYDTLLVNGRFEATPIGFAKMSKSLSIGLLNSMGLTVSPRLVENADLIWLAFSKLKRIGTRLR